MNPEIRTIEQLRNELMGLGYDKSALKIEIKTPYGQFIDLVIFEFDKPKVVFEVKTNTKFSPHFQVQEFRFHPAVRQAQSYAQEISAPYFAVYDGNVIYWFDIDLERGIPRLLQKPILPCIKENGEAKIYDYKAHLLQILFKLGDIARFGPPDLLLHAGLAIFARLISEKGDDTLENDLMTSFNQQQALDYVFPKFDVTLDRVNKAFFPDAFLVLDNIELLKMPIRDFIEAVDDFIQFNINQEKRDFLKLPLWISELMVSLALIKPGEKVLDIYSNCGDIVSTIGKTNPEIKIYSVTSNNISYLWDRIKRLALNINQQDVILIRALNEIDTQISNFVENPDQIIVSPPFGGHLKSDSGYSIKSEDLFLEIALNRVKPDGRIVVIVPENILFSQSREFIRKYIAQRMGVRAIISLEQFMPGTGIKASIIVLDKKSPNMYGGKVMMGRITDKDISGFYDTKSILSSDYIKKLLLTYRVIDNEIMPDEKRIWFIPSQDLDIKSWAVGFYDPTKKTETNSQFPTSSLQDLAKLQKGSPLTLDKNGALPVIGPGAVRTLLIDPTKLDRTIMELIPSSPIISKSGDVLIHAVGANRGQAAIVEQDLVNCYISRNIIVLRIFSSNILPAYLAIILNGNYVKQQLDNLSTGSVISQLSIQNLKDLQIPIPDIPTQIRIIEKINSSRQALIEVEHQEIEIKLALKRQQENLQNILDTIHLGGGENA